MSQATQTSGRGGGWRGRSTNRGGGGWRGGGGRGRGGGGWRGQQGGYRGQGRGFGGNRGGNGGGGRGVSTPRSQHRLSQSTLLDMPTPYKGWRLYFPQKVYSDQSPVVQRAQAFEKYFISWKTLYNGTDIENNGFFTVDFKELLSDQNIMEKLPELATDLRASPEPIISCLGLAMHQMLSQEMQQLSVEEESMTDSSSLLDASQASVGSITSTPAAAAAAATPAFTLPRIHARLINYEPITPLKNLKANYYGKFVSVKGTVVRVSNIKPLCTRMAFECTGCATLQIIALPDGKYVVPTKCPSQECSVRTFVPKRSHPSTETIDWQTIRVQEIINDDHRESGRIPRTVDCELTNDLADSCIPGDMVTVSGIVKVLSSDEGRGRQKDKCMFLLYLYANSVANSKGSKESSSANESRAPGSGGLAIEFTMKELYAIEEIHSESNLFRLIVGSMCPTIYGHELVKAGLVLGLFGGTHRFVNDSNRIPVRGDPHILVVGDPGLGKSQMLQAAANVAPRSVYVCGNTTTTSGLTVTLCKEGGGSGDYALEAGALVLADQGCCCIDEFDKMGSQHQALLEAMEQQCISIAKAGIVCSLPARTSILAAANPVGGHYNKAKTVSENLRMGSALLSRFDLVFILLDKPDEEMDSMLSEHVMAMHAGKKRVTAGTPSMKTPQTPEEEEARLLWESQKALSERLKAPRGEPFDPIPPQLLRKYVGYARKYVHPKISSEAAQMLQKFYLDLRRKHQTQDSTPITTRQLESLIRLTEARARLELREEATIHDASDVVEIMKYSMIDTYMDEFGFLDFQRSQHGSGMSSKTQAKKFVSALQRVFDQTYNSLFTMDQMRQIAKDASIQVRDFEEFVSSLNNQGYLLKKGPRVFQLQTAGY